MKRHSILLCVLLLTTGLLVNAIAAPLPTDGSCLLTIAPGLVTAFAEDALVSGSAFATGDGIGGGNIDEWVSLQPGTDGGIIIGITQPTRAIDVGYGWWVYRDFTTSPVYADCDTGALDFSGWVLLVGGNPVPLGSATDYSITCNGPTYDIDGVHVVSHPTDGNFFNNGVVYTLHLEGDLGAGCFAGCTLDSECDDANPCTDDSCDPATGCVNTPNTDPCDDGDACTTGDVCSGGSCSGTPKDCSDPDPCTMDSCDPVTGTCQNIPNCDDGNICTDDSCDPASGCINAPNSNSCDDGSDCTLNDGCAGGLCTGTPVVCPEGELCVDGVCVLGGLPADTLLTLAPGLVTGTGEGDWVSGSAFAMGDGIGNPDPNQQLDGWNELNPGTDGGIIIGQTQVQKAIDAVWIFFSAKGWHYTSAAPTADATTGALDFTGWTVFWNGGTIPMGSATEYTYTDYPDGTYEINGVKTVSHPTDGNFLFNDVIYTLHLEGRNDMSQCIGVVCNDGNSCTQDTCVPLTGQCVFIPVGCDDGNPCTDESCDSGSGCIHTPNTAPCNDGDSCTTNDTCSEGSCQSGPPIDCNDNNVCTNDRCDPRLGCVYTSAEGPCDDGDSCTVNDACWSQRCQSGSPLCDDGNACTLDLCESGVCTGVLPVDCDDGNPCTDDSCDPALGCVHTFNTGPCDDGSGCTENDTCSNGTCSGAPKVCPAGQVCIVHECTVSALPSGTLLTIAPGLVTGTGEGDRVSGSAFALGDGIGNPAPDQQIDGWNAQAPGTDGGLILGQNQVPKAIDAVWIFHSAKGWHFTSAPPQADDTTGFLDFTGWTAFWNGAPIPMGDSVSYSYTNHGDGTYSIDGAKAISHPTDGNFIFNGVIYTLHLEGDIVPTCDLEVCDDGIDNDCDGIIDGDDSDCCTGSISTTIRGGGQRPTTTDRQIMVEFSVTDGRGCIVDSGVKSVTVNPGTKLGIDWTAGSGPPPSEVTLDGAVIPLNDVYMLTVNGQHKLVLTNKGNGGKDTDRITIDAVP